MDVQRTQFDSYRFVKRLTKAGLSEEVAEILADEHTRLIVPEDVATKADVGAVKADVGAVKADVGSVKADVGSVKADVGAVEADVGAVKADVEALDAKVERVRAEMATKADVAALDAKVERVRAEMATKADIHREIAASEARIEQRLQNAILEAKVSLIKWMVATMMVLSGILVGAMTALQ